MSETLTSTAISLIGAAYLLGSLSGAVLISRWLGLPDPRQQGSMNPGATNILRSGNRFAALLTLIFDASKGAVPVLLAKLSNQPSISLQLIALASIVGHIWPIYFGFRGGKGVATTLGATLALQPWIGLLASLVWLATMYGGRISSLAGIAMACSLPLLSYWLEDGHFWLMCTLASIVAFCHRGNIKRYISGKERRW